MTADEFDDAEFQNFAKRSGDSTLVARRKGLLALEQFVVSGNVTEIETAVQSFDGALGADGQRQYDRPADCDAQLNKFGSVFASEQWTPGRFIVFDFLRERHSGPLAVRSEVTPILAVGEIVGLNDQGGVLNLIVESLPGPHGLITPDFSSFGNVAFPDGPNGPAGNFISIMHAAFRAGLLPDRQVRLRWRLKLKWGEFPRVMRGQSAEAAAACCARALMSRTTNDAGPLLDEQVAITACLGEVAGTFDDRPLKAVQERTLNAKFQAGTHARLAAVLVVDGQVPANQREYKSTAKVDDKPIDASVLIQPVARLGEAYDSLLTTAAAVQEYKKRVCDVWCNGNDVSKGWVDSPTPPEFVEASKRG